MKATWARVVVFLFVITALAVTPANAQTTTTGSVSGTVVDETEAVIPGATVRLINEATGVTREQESNAAGLFNFDRVSPGTYTVTIIRQGFRTYERTSIGVRVGKVTSLGSVALEVGPTVEVVTVEDTTAPLMQAESAQITGNYTSEIVTETMLGTFGLDVLAFLTPGVQPGLGFTNSNIGFGNTNFGSMIGGSSFSQPAANGMRERFTGYSIDGQDNNDITVGGPGFFIDMFDTVEEYQIATNIFSAELGRNLGASINIITKSGTNEHHGTIYWFHENADQLTARSSDESQADEPVSKFIENFFGFTWGGPAVTDKLFGFAAFQRVKDDFSQFDDTGPFSLDLATTAARGAIAGLGTNTADFVATKTGFASPFGNPVCQPGRLLGFESALLGLGATGVDPTGTFAFFDHFIVDTAAPPLFTLDLIPPFGVPDTGFLPVTASALNVPWCSILRTPGGNFTQDEFTGKIDWVGEKNSAGGRYMFQDTTVGPFDFLFNGVAVVNVPSRGQFANFYHTIQLSPRMLNEFRFSYARLGVFFEGNNDLSPFTFPTVEIEKNLAFIINDLPFNLMGGVSGIPQGRIGNNFQFADHWSLVYGRHTLKAGIEVRRVRFVNFFLPNRSGTWLTLFGLGTAAGATNATCQTFFATGVGCFGPNFLADSAGMDELLTNNIISFSATASGEVAMHTFETHQFYYFQDDFRIRPNLTFNLGVRYEYFGQPIDGISKQVIERESDPAQALWLQSLPIEDRTLPVIGGDKNNFAPRIGFAYTPRFWKRIFGEDQTVIRGGYGISYDVGFQNILLNTHNNAPRVFAQSRLFSPVNIIPGDGTGTALDADPTLAPTRNLFDPRRFTNVPVSGQFLGTNDLYNPYAQQWSLGIQREVKGTVAEVRYVGTRGVGLYAPTNFNPAFTEQLALFPETVPAGLTPDPNTGLLFGTHGVVELRGNLARSEYHGLQTRWDFRNLFNQFTGGVSWTWSKNIDNASEVFSETEAGLPEEEAANSFDIVDGERGLSNLDLRNTFTWHAIWHAPWRRDQIGALGKIAGGWEVAMTGFIFSGRPWTANQTSSGINFPVNDVCDENLFFASSNLCRPVVFNPEAPVGSVGEMQPGGSCVDRGGSTVACSSLHWLMNNNTIMNLLGTPFGSGRNLNAGDGSVLVNLGIFKNTYVNLGENRVNIQFRSQFVNATNHRNFGVPPLTINSGIFADEAQENTPGRTIRFGIRVVF
ncbi:MAG: carboxypeptidase regulatory-like domain-containing protein [Terriglobia bacterium]